MNKSKMCRSVTSTTTSTKKRDIFLFTFSRFSFTSLMSVARTARPTDPRGYTIPRAKQHNISWHSEGGEETQ